MKTLFLLGISIAVLTSAFGSGGIVDLNPGPVGKERVALEVATRSLVTSGDDLAGLETVIANLPPGVLDSIGSSFGYRFEDASREAALNALQDWYSIDFLQEAMKNGSDDAAYWALRKLSHQAMNGPQSDKENDSIRRLVARGGVVTAEVRTRLFPELEKLRTAKSERTRKEAIQFAQGLLLDRAAFLQALQEKDEKLLNVSLMQMLDQVRMDPHLSPEIWAILMRAKTDSLRGTCLRYPWLFEGAEWDAPKSLLFTHFMNEANSAAFTNVRYALTMLAVSDNPVARQVFAEIAAAGDKVVKKQVAEFREMHRAKHQ